MSGQGAKASGRKAEGGGQRVVGRIRVSAEGIKHLDFFKIDVIMFTINKGPFFIGGPVSF